MKRSTALMAVCMLILSVSLAHALPQYTISTTTGRIGDGGPFQITGVTNPSVSFQTFCVERGEYIDLPATYYGSIDSLVYYSSGSSTFSAAINSNTALVYNYFLDHQATLSDTDKRNIQLAIWMYQGQLTIDHSNFYVDKIDHGNLSASNRTIMALNLWDADVGNAPYNNESDYCHRKQSQLIATPEPGTLLLMGLGLIGLAGLRRKNS
jgi:hypothetical protein